MGHPSDLPHTGPYLHPERDTSPEKALTLPEAAVVPLPVRAAPVTVGPYEIIEEIGRGGMGIVYKARHTQLGRVVALKTIRADLAEGADEAIRFAREAQAAATLAHPNIVPIFEVGRHDGRPYYAMAFIGGGSLAQHRDRFADDPRSAAALVETVARAVHYAHEHGILHRDLKPANVLLDEHGAPMVHDFGVAKLRDADHELTQTGAVLGTPAYMAPEQAAGRTAQVGPATDVWALGVILYELLTGRRPFQGGESGDLKRHILQDDPPRLRSVCPGLDRALELIVLKCLDKEPGRRYASAGALADDLACWRRDEPVSARPERLPRRAWRTLRRHPRASISVLALGLIAVLTAAVLYHFDPDRPLKDIQRRLMRGESVTLVPETGAPLWSRWGTSLTGSLESPAPSRAFAFSSLERCLLELLPDAKRDRYRLRAQVKHVDGPTGLVGLYFAHQKFPLPDGEQDCLATVTFSDQWALFKAPGRAQRQSRVALEVEHWRGSGQSHSATGQLASFAPEPEHPPWRDLAIEVTPDSVRLFWEHQAFGQIRRAELNKAFRDFLSPRAADPQVGLQPDFGPRGGVGLVVHKAQAAFRNVVIEPLDE